MQFRLDINGLRAIAVLAVLLFHFKIPGFKGGFIGVDVFFVISGFLMTRIIVGRIEKGNFGVLDFYRARAVRIVPALLAMCLFVLGWAWFYLMPQDYELLAKHALGSVTFLSNIAYWSEASYFAETAYGKWLLHTWSLSLEWQFYLLYPLLIAALVKLFKSNMRALRMWICLLFVISLACSILMTPRSSSAAFFLLPSRAWEMLAGGLVCLYPLQLKPRWKLPVEVTGILLIGASIALFHPNHAWPGWRALGPVVGCVLVLAAASQRSLLASMPFQWLGNISYSVYLWHWPVVVALHYFSKLHDPLLVVAGIFLSVAAGWLSYRFVELPTQHAMRQRASDSRVRKGIGPAPIAGIFAALVLAGGAMVFAKESFMPLPPEARRLISQTNADTREPMRGGFCFLTSESNDMRKLMNGPCLRIVPGRVNTLLIGDSHAAHFWAGLADTLPNANVLQATASGCVPVVGASGAPRCTALMEEIFSKFIPQHKGEIDAVILSGRWKATDGPRLIETIQQIRQSIPTVYVFGPIAEYDLPLPSLLARGVYFKNPDLHKEFLVPDRKILDHSMEASLAGSGATYISVYDKICPIGGECATLDHNGMPLQFDYGHLTRYGAGIVVRSMMGQSTLGR